MFKAELDEVLSKFNIHKIEFEQFSYIFLEILEKHEP